MKVAEDRKRVPCALDRRISVAVEGGQAGLADAKHAEVARVRCSPEEPLCDLELLPGLFETPFLRLDAGREEISARKLQRVVGHLEQCHRAADLSERLRRAPFDRSNTGE